VDTVLFHLKNKKNKNEEIIFLILPNFQSPTSSHKLTYAPNQTTFITNTTHDGI